MKKRRVMHKCIELECDRLVFKVGERCWKCWLKVRDKNIAQYQKR